MDLYFLPPLVLVFVAVDAGDGKKFFHDFLKVAQNKGGNLSHLLLMSEVFEQRRSSGFVVGGFHLGINAFKNFSKIFRDNIAVAAVARTPELTNHRRGHDDDGVIKVIAQC